MAKKRRRWLSAVAVIALATVLVGTRLLSSPLILYPASPSLPAGPYLRSFEPIRIGKIVAFAMPDAARRYQIELGHDVPASFLFMKPIIAGPGDRVCNSVVDGLVVNGTWRASTVSHDRDGRLLPVWTACHVLGEDRYFMVSDHVPNSFDSRYFGPVDAARIAAVYRPLF
ncbi:MAG: S26 family signal peptidase [Nitrospirota bacterium]|nr:S26 family signal peptidase [Nitrospirota bacterium]